MGVFSSSPSQGNIEVGPGSTSSLVSTGSSTPAIYHLNAYLRLAAPQWYGPSSRARLARLKQLLPAQLPFSAAAIPAILGDTAGDDGSGAYPIFRNGVAPDDVETMATVFFDLVGGTAWLYTGNAKNNIRSSLALPFSTQK